MSEISERLIHCELACAQHAARLATLDDRLAAVSAAQSICCGADGEGGNVKAIWRDMGVTTTRVNDHAKRLQAVELAVAKGYVLAGVVAAVGSVGMSVVVQLLMR